MQRPQKPIDFQALRHGAWKTVTRWGWIVPVMLAFVGMLLGSVTGDHRMASRSAAVLLVTCALVVVQEWLR